MKTPKERLVLVKLDGKEYMIPLKFVPKGFIWGEFPKEKTTK